MATEYDISAKITADSTGYEKGVKKAQNSTTSFSKSLSNLGKTVKSIFVAGLFAKLTKEVISFSNSFAQARGNIVKGTGAIGDDLAKLNQSVTESLRNGVARNAQEIGSMIADLNTRFNATGEQLNSLVSDFDKFSRVTGTDTKTSINSIADVMAKWNIKTEDTDKLLDQLVKASQMSGASVNELTSGLKIGEAIFEQFGMNITQSTAFLASLSKNGVDASNAIFGMRTALAKFSKEGKNAEIEYEKISKKIKNAKTESEALNIAVDTFGSRAGPEMVKVLRNTSDGFSTFEESLKKAGGTLEYTEKVSRTSKEALDSLIATIKGLYSEISGDEIDNIVKNTLDDVSRFFQELDVQPIIDFVNETKSVFKDMYDFVSQVFSLYYENIKTALNKVLDSVGFSKKSFEGWRDDLWNIFDGVYRIVQDHFNMVSSILKGDFVVAWEYAKLEVMRVGDLILDIISRIANAFPKLTDKIVDAINELIKAYNTVMGWFGKEGKDLIKPLANINLSESLGLERQIAETEKRIQELTGKSADIQLKHLKKVESASEDTNDVRIDGEIEFTKVEADETEKRKKKTLEGIKSNLKKIKEYSKLVISIVKTLTKDIIDITSKVVSNIIKVAKGMISTLKSLAEVSISDMLDELLKIEDGILTFFVDTLPQIPAFIGEIISSVTEMFRSINEYFKSIDLGQIVFDMLTAISDNLPDFVSEFVTFLSNVVSGAITGLGQWIRGDGLANLLSALLDLQKGLEQIVTDNIDEFVDSIIDALPEIMKTIKDSIISASQTLAKIIGPLVKLITEIIAQLIDVVTSDEVIDASIEVVSAIIEAMIVDAKLVKVVNSLVKGIIKIITNIPKLTVSIIEAIFSGLINMDWIEFVEDIFTGFVDAIKAFFGIHSPSTLFIELGEFMVEGLKIGLEGIKEITEVSLAGVKETLEVIGDILIGISEVSFSGINDGILAVGEAIARVTEAVAELVRALAELNESMGMNNLTGGAGGGGGLPYIPGVSEIIDDIKEGDIGRGIADVLTGGLFSGLGSIFGWATGVNNAPKGLAVVGEQGPELVDFRGGERVYNAQNTKSILSGSGSGVNNFNVTFNNLQDTSAYTMIKQLKAYNRQMAINGVL